ncbi:hypothetical protein ABGN35_004749 [Yersinia enterocolitica]
MMTQIEVKARTQRLLNEGGIIDLHGAVFCMSFGLSEPIPEDINQALMEIFNVPREAIIFAIADWLREIHQLTIAEIESALKYFSESAQ